MSDKQQRYIYAIGTVGDSGSTFQEKGVWVPVADREPELEQQLAEQAATIAQLEKDLKIAQSQAIQARAQAVTVSAERDQLRQELAQQRKANITAFENGQAQGYTNAHRELQADARELAQALRDAPEPPRTDAIRNWETFIFAAERWQGKRNAALSKHAQYLAEPPA